MKPQLFLLLTVGLLLAADTTKEDPAKDALKKLEGDWEVVGMERPGKKLSDDQVKAMNFRVTFKEKQILSRIGAVTMEATYQIDATKEPKTIDVTDRSNKIERGIYKIEGDTLTICTAPAGEKTPADFDLKPASGHTLLRLKRVR